ncbi:MAG: SURF1 family protein [Candidatus Eisenbacteria bacterium]
MTLRRLLAVALVISAALACARLGFWQLSRLAEKRALNATLRAALAAPPVLAWPGASTLEELRKRQVELRGRFDSRYQVLLRGRPRDGEPGVIVVTPFLLGSESTAVMVERGWLAAEDAATVPAEQIPEDSSLTVVGLAEDFPSGAPIPPLREMGTPMRNVWSAPRLVLDSLRARIPFRIAPYFVRALPGHGAPASPTREVPRLHDESVHMGYALQWFAIAAMFPAGAWLLARRRRRR